MQKFKKEIKSKKWLVFRNIMFALMAITFILAIILSVLSHYQMDKYIEALQQSGYEIEMQESVYSRKSS